MHGIKWPVSNPKSLVVDYSTGEELANRLSGKDQAAPPASGKQDPNARRGAAVVAAVAAQAAVDSRREKGENVREWDLGKVGGAPGFRR